MHPITGGETKRYGHAVKCMLCKAIIPADTTCYNRQGFIACTKHKAWMEKNVAPSRLVHRRKAKSKLRHPTVKELQDMKDTAKYTEVFTRHKAEPNRNIAGIVTALKDYYGEVDW